MMLLLLLLLLLVAKAVQSSPVVFYQEYYYTQIRTNEDDDFLWKVPFAVSSAIHTYKTCGGVKTDVVFLLAYVNGKRVATLSGYTQKTNGVVYDVQVPVTFRCEGSRVIVAFGGAWVLSQNSTKLFIFEDCTPIPAYAPQTFVTDAACVPSSGAPPPPPIPYTTNPSFSPTQPIPVYFEKPYYTATVNEPETWPVIIGELFPRMIVFVEHNSGGADCCYPNPLYVNRLVVTLYLQSAYVPQTGRKLAEKEGYTFKRTTSGTKWALSITATVSCEDDFVYFSTGYPTPLAYASFSSSSCGMSCDQARQVQPFGYVEKRNTGYPCTRVTSAPTSRPTLRPFTSRPAPGPVGSNQAASRGVAVWVLCVVSVWVFYSYD